MKAVEVRDVAVLFFTVLKVELPFLQLPVFPDLVGEEFGQFFRNLGHQRRFNSQRF